MNTQRHRTCIRMSQEEYDLLKEKSRAAGLSANAWLMRELERNRPMIYREEETRAAIAFADEAGRDSNWAFPSSGWPRWWSNSGR